MQGFCVLGMCFDIGSTIPILTIKLQMERNQAYLATHSAHNYLLIKKDYEKNKSTAQIESLNIFVHKTI